MMLNLLRNTTFLLLAATLLPAGAQAQFSLDEVWKLDQGLDRPESAVYDAERDVLYVSSIGGAPSEKDGNGYLSRVSPEGEMVQQKWITGGMNAPKGLSLSGGRLYTADIDTLVEIDPESGKILNRYQVDEQGDSFLNDVTADADGNIYVSDSSLSKIYRLHDGQFEVWLDDPSIQSPNGLHVLEGKLIAAAADDMAKNPGGSRYLRVIDLETREIQPLAGREPIGGVDAVEPDGQGGFFLSDWAAGKVMHFTSGGEVNLLKDLSQGTADLEYVDDHKMVYLPIMMSDQLIGYRVSQ